MTTAPNRTARVPGRLACPPGRSRHQTPPARQPNPELSTPKSNLVPDGATVVTVLFVLAAGVMFGAMVLSSLQWFCHALVIWVQTQHCGPLRSNVNALPGNGSNNDHQVQLPP